MERALEADCTIYCYSNEKLRNTPDRREQILNASE